MYKQSSFMEMTKLLIRPTNNNDDDDDDYLKVSDLQDTFSFYYAGQYTAHNDKYYRSSRESASNAVETRLWH